MSGAISGLCVIIVSITRSSAVLSTMVITLDVLGIR